MPPFTRRYASSATVRCTQAALRHPRGRAASGEGRVRCIAMVATEGMVRGMKAIDTGSVITIPVGRATLGGCSTYSASRSTSSAGQTPRSLRRSIARPPASTSSRPAKRCLRPASRSSTDPALPLKAQDRPVRGRGRGQDRHHPGTHNTWPPSTAAFRYSPASASVPANATTCGSSFQESGVIDLKVFSQEQGPPSSMAR